MANRQVSSRHLRRGVESATRRGDTSARPQELGTRTWLIRAGVSAYVILLLVVPPQWLDPAWHDVWRLPQLGVHHGIGWLLDAFGVVEPSKFFRVGAYYIVTALLVPLMFCVAAGRRRPADTGWRKPNRLLVRIVGLSFVVAIPFLFWMVNSPEFLPYYRPYLAERGSVVITYYIVVLFCEHFLFEGVMLAAFRATGRWPQPAKLLGDGGANEALRWRRLAQWFGLAQPVGRATGVQRLTRWAGLPDGCVGAIVLSGVMFGLVHWGKAGREFVLAFPGGVFLAALAYRCNSWHAPYLLHAGTVTAAAGMFLLSHR